MKHLCQLCSVIFLMFLMAGCAPSKSYIWNDYDKKLYEHYKNPAEYDQFVEGMKVTIESGEATGKVPPGLYAEYGFLFYERGKIGESLIYFQKEHDAWPESQLLMTKMISNAKRLQKSTAKDQPALATEVKK